jgi:PAS domain S-box-containing protein
MPSPALPNDGLRDPAAPLRVLVVDDTATNRQILQVFLRKLGFEVETRDDGAQAVARFAEAHYDLVLMDVMMPVMDGYEATRQIKAMCGDRWVPVIFLSALDKEENLVAGLDAGGDDYLPKPINFVILDAKLRSLKRSLRLQQTLEDHRRRTQAITDNVLDAIITIDERGVIETVNHAAERMFGYRQEELVGSNVSSLMPEPYRSAHDDYLAAYVGGGPSHIIGIGQRQVDGLRKDGSTFPLELGVSEMMFEGRRLFIGVLRDIAQRKLAERQLQDYLARLQAYRNEREAENVLARGIIDRQMHRPGLLDPQLTYWFVPAYNFRGDIVAAARSSDGKLYVLLADATGHGLSAAISVVPVLTAFYALVEQCYSLGFIAHELNRHLIATLPAERFVAASLMCLDPNADYVEVWQGGTPDILQLDAAGSVKRRVMSSHMPLGIIDFEGNEELIQRLPVAPGDQFVIYSDGLIESANSAGLAFGTTLFEEALAGPAAGRLVRIREALVRHAGAETSHDDISLMLVDAASG